MFLRMTNRFAVVCSCLLSWIGWRLLCVRLLTCLQLAWPAFSSAFGSTTTTTTTAAATDRYRYADAGAGAYAVMLMSPSMSGDGGPMVDFFCVEINCLMVHVIYSSRVEKRYTLTGGALRTHHRTQSYYVPGVSSYEGVKSLFSTQCAYKYATCSDMYWSR